MSNNRIPIYELTFKGNKKPPTDESIKNAINNRHHVIINYEDDSDDILNGVRLILPHTYGKGYVPPGYDYPINDDKYVRGYIIRASSKTRTDNQPYWRLFKFSRITHWGIMRIKFKVKPDYVKDDKMLYKIISQI